MKENIRYSDTAEVFGLPWGRASLNPFVQYIVGTAVKNIEMF